ncbi:MAG: helix-turn-helix transcriptional regulator [Actinomycetota bacterium]
MSLVGRKTALAEIDGALRALPHGPAALLCLSGEPGIGKTRLLSELAAKADARGYLVLEGRAAEFETDAPFALFVDALDDYLSSASDRVLGLLPPATRARLATVFPAVPQPADASATSLQAERYLVHRAVRSLLDALAVQAPLVLVIDDLHWADPASTELVNHLLGHPSSGNVLIATGYRPSQLDPFTRAALDRAVGEGRVHALELPPLSKEESQALVGDDVAPDEMEVLYAESGGIPFYLIELSRQPPRPVDKVRPAGGVPAAVLASIDREIAALPDGARLLAQGGAVAGDPFALDDAVTAAGTTTEDALASIDHVLSGGLVASTDVPRRFRFRHPIVRRAVYESAGNGWRIGAHRRLADALSAQGAAPTRLAHHVAITAELGDDAAVDVLSAAGEATMAHAPAIAASHFESALRLLPAADPRRPELLVPLATALGAAGRFTDCRARIDDALALLPPQATQARTGLTAFCAAIEHLLGEHASAHTRLVAELDTLPRQQPVEAATLLVQLAADALWRSDWAAMADWAERASEAARTAEATAVEAQGLALLAWADFGVGRIRPALDALTRAETMVDDTPDQDLVKHFGATFYLARAGFMLERFESAVRYAERGLAMGRTAGRDELFISLLTARSAGLRMLGRLDEATAAAQEAVESAQLVGHEQVLALAMLDRMASATAAGDLELALATGQEVHHLTTRLGPSPASVVVGFLFGEALLAAGDADRCVTVARDGLGDPDGTSFAVPGRCNTWSLLARAEAARGRLDHAHEWIDRLDALLPSLEPLALPAWQTEYARATLLLASGDADGAAQAALLAGEAADSRHARVEAGRAHTLAGRALAAVGRRDDAIARLEQARGELGSCGARRYHDEAVRELRQLGVRIGRGGRRADGDSGVLRLSEREREIADLVAEGRTNKEIGETLFISTRTVERHLSHIFDKLGLASRTQLSSVIARSREEA